MTSANAAASWRLAARAFGPIAFTSACVFSSFGSGTADVMATFFGPGLAQRAPYIASADDREFHGSIILCKCE
jgi:hypothetical protein